MFQSMLVIAGLIGWLIAASGRGEAAQNTFPSRPVDIVTHASPGGGTDMTARTMLIGARDALGVSMAVVPKVGGGGLVAMSYVASQPRDGYTVMGITPTHLYAIARGQGPLRIEDLVGVARAADDPIVVMVRAASDLETLDDLLALGRRRPIKWGATQIGGVDHIAGAMLAELARTELSVVPFGGGGEIVTNLMGGIIDAAGLNLTEGLDQIRRGDFRALAVMAEHRMEAIAEVPTTVELGYDAQFSTVRGYVVLAGTPPERIEALEHALLKGLSHPAYQTYLKGAGLDSGSVAGREVWDAQIGRMYQQARTAMVRLGIVPN
ncbi:MAG TPA: tripartite tricarboxylate transporter substrate binding protein [Vicinamibacteria bacterium]|nr:tripartite tricarboxylate transporter substrate binding protein [Vicinamibacteria bacterium]